jgi:ATP/maltotriose-dependent transcriptional regulator MalT
MKRDDVVITEFSRLSNGETTTGAAALLHISLKGCPHRGSTTCLDCPLAMYRARECDYRCAEGLTNREIASRLFLALNTVKVHARNIYGKPGVNSRTQAVARARALGILPST